MRHQRGSLAILGILGSACGQEVTPEREELASLTQALVRTSDCLDGSGAPITVTASPPAWPNDAAASIQSTINVAKARANAIAGSCTVRAYIPNGTWLITNTLYVPGRVHLIGQDVNLTRLIKVPNALGVAGSAVELGDPSLGGCPAIKYVKVQQLRIEMRDTYDNPAPPTLGSEHCIRSRTGISDFEIRNVNLKYCRFYGIGLQIVDACQSTGEPYKDFTIKGVKLDWSGSDGIDIKALNAAESDPGKQNANGELHDLCFSNIGQHGDGNWDSAFDLSGRNLWVSNVQAINDTRLPFTAGIDLGGGARRVTNSTIEQFYVKRYITAFTADVGSANVVVRDGALKESTWGANLAAGTDNIDTSGSSVCASLNTQGDLSNLGTNNDWSWGSCPTPSIPACSY